MFNHSDSTLEFYEHIVRTEHKSLLRLASILLSSKTGKVDIHRAEDAVQETFTIAWEKQELFLNHPNPSGWLIVTLKNVVRNMSREEQKWSTYLLQVSEDMVHPPPDAALELEGIVSSEDLFLLKRLYLYKETYDEVCQDLGIKKSTLAMRVKRIKENFKKNYKESEKIFLPECEQMPLARHDTNEGGSKE